MSRVTAKKANELEAQPQLIFDSKRDINPFWRSSLFSDVYLKNDIPREYKHLWENDEIGGFYDFYQGFVNLCVETEHETFEKWKEADTVKNWIVHVMDLLGWENNSEKRSNSYMDNESFTISDNGRKQTYRPDLIYFDKPKHKSYTQKEKDIDLKLSEARNKRTGTKIVVEAKYWDRLSHISETSKKDSSANDSASALGPELQTLKYMEIFDHDFGILTDGKTWRLFHKELSQGMDRRSFDFDLGNLRELALDLGSFQNEEKFKHYAKYFYYFFAKKSIVQSEDSKSAPLVYEVFEYSKKYAHSIEEDLKKRFIITMGVTCNSLKESCEELGEDVDLSTIRNVAESHLFNILFVKSCEVRRIMPISSTQYLRLSLHEVIETLDAMSFDPDKDWDDYLRDFRYSFGKKFDWDGYEIFNRFINLYEIIHDGTAKSKDFGFEVDGFKESIFSKPEWKFAKKHKINNHSMVKILFNLNFIESSFRGRKHQQIPYSYFTPRQLGSIYESFLEYRLEIAEDDMIFKKGKWSKANLKSSKVKNLGLVDHHQIEKGNLFFSPDNKDRKMTGSYYTPDNIVKYMIKETLDPITKDLKSSELLELKILDPAMGSGHFLAGALDYLVSSYREKWSEENNDDLDEDIAETSRNILHSCINGVDLNPRAVKLSKMSLWLTTACAGNKLEHLEDQLRTGDSLISFNWEKEFKAIFKKKKGFDAIVQNPPYIFARNQKLTDEDKENFDESFTWATYQANTYLLFIEKSYDLLNEGGRLGAIIPNNWLSIETCQNFRKEYFSNFFDNIIINSKDRIFEGVAVDNSILFSSKSASEINADEALIEAVELSEGEFNSIGKVNPQKETYKIFFQNWDSEVQDLFNILDSSQTLADVALVKTGLKAYQRGKGKPKQTNTEKESRIFHSTTPKGKGCYPYLKGRDVCRYELKKPTEYLLYGKHLAEPRQIELFTSSRILVRQIPSKPPYCIHAISTDEHYLNDINSMVVVPNDPKMVHFILGVLNSEVISKWFIYKFDKFQRSTFPQFKINELKSFPIPEASKADIKMISSLVKRAISLRSKGKVEEAEKLDAEINNAVLHLIEVSSEEAAA